MCNEPGQSVEHHLCELLYSPLSNLYQTRSEPVRRTPPGGVGPGEERSLAAHTQTQYALLSTTLQGGGGTRGGGGGGGGTRKEEEEEEEEEEEKNKWTETPLQLVPPVCTCVAGFKGIPL